MTSSHWNPDGTCSCPMDGECCECKGPCNDHDLVGYPADQDGIPGFPTYWCNKCINRHFGVTDECVGSD